MCDNKEIVKDLDYGPQADELQIMYLILINNEEQYSLWPSYLAIPNGWKAIGKERTKDECLSYIEKTWIDMRPLSLRKQMKRRQNQK